MVRGAGGESRLNCDTLVLQFLIRPSGVWRRQNAAR